MTRTRGWVWIVALAVLCVPGCKRHRRNQERVTGPPPKYKLSSGWRSHIANHPKILDQGSDGWVALFEHRYQDAIQTFSASTNPTDRVGLGRTYLALGELFWVAHQVSLEVQRKYYQFRIKSREQLQVGTHTSFFLAWTLAELGLIREARVQLSAYVQAPGAAPPLRAMAQDLLQRSEKLEQGRPLWVDCPATTHRLAKPVPIISEKIRERQTEAVLRYFAPNHFRCVSTHWLNKAVAVFANQRGFAAFYWGKALFGLGRVDEAWLAFEKFLSRLPTAVEWQYAWFNPLESIEDFVYAARVYVAACKLRQNSSDTDAAAKLDSQLKKNTPFAPIVLSAAWPEMLPRADAQQFLRSRLKQIGPYCEQVRKSWTGPGVQEMLRMELAERHCIDLALELTLGCAKFGEGLRQGLPGLETFYDPAHVGEVSIRHSPRFLLVMAAAYLDANRCNDSLAILNEMNRRYPLLEPLHDVATLYAISQHIDTKGAVRRE